MSTKIKEAMEVLMDELNVVASHDEASAVIMDVLKKTHPTVRQSFFREMHTVLIEYGDMRGDLRDEGSRTWAAKASSIEGTSFPFI